MLITFCDRCRKEKAEKSGDSWAWVSWTAPVDASVRQDEPIYAYGQLYDFCPQCVATLIPKRKD